ncbi:unnamed protein product, partial [Cyprideis torosa]
MPLDICSPVGISILANTISLTPGTVSCELTADHKMLLIHSLHVDDIDASIEEMKKRYERPLMEILQSCPSVPDRILALDTLYLNTIALLILFGLIQSSPLYFEAALLIAVMGFVGTI